MSYRTEDFDFHLPAGLIATEPLKKRDRSRLLVLNRSDGMLTHATFSDIGQFLRSGDCLAVNTTKVFKARLFAKRSSGGEIELLLVRRLTPGEFSSASRSGSHWAALIRPSRRIHVGERLLLADRLTLTAVAPLGNGQWHVHFSSLRSEVQAITRYGHVPLPGYMKRPDRPEDLRRYQTIFAEKEHVGAVAAPTAGLHFTRSLLRQLQNDGIGIAPLTLHVGPGTFKPILTEAIADHRVDPEFAQLTSVSADRLNAARRQGGRIVAVGTTSVRTLESAAGQGGTLSALDRAVDLFISPGYQFRTVDVMVTNFHLPKSSLLVLVAAFAGYELTMEAYQTAIRERYRFYSYGDAMLIL